MNERSQLRRRKMLGSSLAVFVVAAISASASGQQPSPSNSTSGQRTSTTLAPAFVAKTGNADLYWPTQDMIDAVCDKRGLNYAHYDSYRWQLALLAPAYRAAPDFPDVGCDWPRRVDADAMRATLPYGFASEFTAALSYQGYDSIYHHWEAGAYRFQFQSTRGRFVVAVQPIGESGAERQLSDDEIRTRAGDVIANVLCNGRDLRPQLKMDLSRVSYGSDIRVSFALSGSEAVEKYDHTLAREFLRTLLFGTLTVRTDGYSFVFEMRKCGSGASLDGPPDTKEWFHQEGEEPGQEPPPERLPTTPTPDAGTALDRAFAAKLGDVDVYWPTRAMLRPEAVRREEDWEPRSNALLWQAAVLAEPYRATPFLEVGDKDIVDVYPRGPGPDFTAAVSYAGYDSIYDRWEADGYRLQFQCTYSRFVLAVQPKDERGGAEPVKADDVANRVYAVAAAVIYDGAELPKVTRMTVTPTAYGYDVEFDLTDKWTEMRRTDHSLPAWFHTLRVRTDGYSFVFDTPKWGLGYDAPEPDRRQWFSGRAPDEPK